MLIACDGFVTPQGEGLEHCWLLSGGIRSLSSRPVNSWGMESCRDEALEFYGIVPDTYMIGDCKQVANIHVCNRGAFSVTSNL